MPKRGRKTLYLPMDYLPPGHEFLVQSWGISVVDEHGWINQWETERLRMISTYYRTIVFTDRSPDD